MKNKIHLVDKSCQSESGFATQLRDVVFGAEDGMVSTLGAITGIAIGADNQFMVLLSGCVIISVESISMGIGSYISKKAEEDADKRKIVDERCELKNFPEEGDLELEKIYIKNGWPKRLAREMAQVAFKNKKIALKEMIYHKIGISKQDINEKPIKNGIFMFFSYVVGGLIPLLSYFFFPFHLAIIISVSITMLGLFLLGVWTTRFSKRKWWRAGFEMFALAGIASVAGFAVGQLADRFLVK
ncbi:MAG: VIT1/CCC1 transporter family protein [Patescibacteria group bacterium]